MATAHSNCRCLCHKSNLKATYNFTVDFNLNSYFDVSFNAFINLDAVLFN